MRKDGAVNFMGWGRFSVRVSFTKRCMLVVYLDTLAKMMCCVPLIRWPVRLVQYLLVRINLRRITVPWHSCIILVAMRTTELQLFFGQPKAVGCMFF